MAVVVGASLVRFDLHSHAGGDHEHHHGAAVVADHHDHSFDTEDGRDGSDVLHVHDGGLTGAATPAVLLLTHAVPPSVLRLSAPAPLRGSGTTPPPIRPPIA